ncbi:MAG: cytochrome c3 family protein [Desulfobacterales bacterium]|nr:MAG: cytochrome c3 family protein [Desulfobacterales bacterium]
MKSKIVILLIILGMLIGVALAADIQKMGAPDIVLDGGKRGAVHFPHRIHQDVLIDCNICHEIFPQIPGTIANLKDKGRLEKKQVMNHCKGCHKKLTNAGNKAGPVTCNKCHLK